MKVADELRWRFEKLMRANELSVDQDKDGKYKSTRVRDGWFCYELGAKAGIDLAPMFVAEKLTT